ncbi:hypothetical protein Tco_1517867 [Tanacetum coccineum]
MRTRSTSKLIVESFTIPKRRNRRRSKQIVKPKLQTIIEAPVATMTDTRTMSELLQAPTEGGFDERLVRHGIHVKDLLRKCPYHGFLELHQIDTFYNALTQSDQDSLNAAAGVEREPEATKDKVQTTSSGSTSYVQPPVVQVPIPEPDITFRLSFADALLHMPKFSSTFKSLLSNKEKLFEWANTLLNENCSAELKYSYRYDDESVNRIDVLDITCEEYAQEVIGFSDSSMSGNPTPSSDPIITTSSLSLTPFEGGDFVLEEIEACLTSDSILPGIDDADFDPEGDILLLEKLLKNNPPSPLPPKELNFEELKIIKSSIDDPSELELKDLPSHLEYAFLEGTNKLPVITAKNLKDEEKARLLKVLKSHKVLMALSEKEKLNVGKNHVRNGEWVNITIRKSVSRTVTVECTEPVTPLVSTEVKNDKHESKLNELTKLVQMLVDEKVN